MKSIHIHPIGDKSKIIRQKPTFIHDNNRKNTQHTGNNRKLPKHDKKYQYKLLTSNIIVKC